MKKHGKLIVIACSMLLVSWEVYAAYTSLNEYESGSGASATAAINDQGGVQTGFQHGATVASVDNSGVTETWTVWSAGLAAGAWEPNLPHSVTSSYPSISGFWDCAEYEMGQSKVSGHGRTALAWVD